MSADDALAAVMEVSGGDGAGGALSEAMNFLQEGLGVADRVKASIIDKQARKAGIFQADLAGRQRETGVVSKREGFGADGKFFLSLPQLRPIETQDQP